MTTLTEADDGMTTDAAVGEDIAVRLSSNRTTGYSWKLVSSSTGVLSRPGDSTYVGDATTPGAVGVGGVESWSFRANRTGSEELRFEYRRAWESATPPAKAVQFTVRVR